MHWIAVTVSSIVVTIVAIWNIYREHTQPSKAPGNGSEDGVIRSKNWIRIMSWITGIIAAIILVVLAIEKPSWITGSIAVIAGITVVVLSIHQERKQRPKGAKGMSTRHLICGILASVLLLWVIYKTPRLHLRTVVDYGKWKAPCCMKEELRTVDIVRGAFGKKAQHNLHSIMDANSMYCVSVQNEGPSVANHVAITLPDVNHVEVMREGKEPEEVSASEVIPLGKIKSKEEVCINAWATCPVSRHNATGVAIFNESGTAPIYVRTPVGAIARWINLHITRRAVSILIVVALFCVFAHWATKKLIEMSSQAFRRLKGK